MILLILSIGLLIAFLSPSLHRIAKDNLGLLLAIYPLSFLLFLLSRGSSATVETHTWIERFNINFSFQLNELGWLFGVLVSFFAIFIFVYASKYMSYYKGAGRFFLALCMFFTAMMGIVLSENLISLFLFWEMTSFSSFLLIGFFHEDESSRRSAMQSMVITVGGGLFFLLGVLLLGHVVGSYEIRDVIAQKDLLIGHSFTPYIVGLILMGAMTKSAQFPFHFWLPNAMAAPTPVSAFLHSATMVKAGVFLVMRMYPALGWNEIFTTVLLLSGAITMLLGAWRSVVRLELKAILANTTISALGIIMMFLGLGTAKAIAAAVVFLFAHAFYKATLFLVAGNVIKAKKDKNIGNLAGNFKDMPQTGLASWLGALSMAGMIPFLGFLGKELLYGSAFEAGSLIAYILLGATFISSAFFVVVALRFSWYLFKPGSQDTGHELNSKELPFGLTLSPLVFSIGGLTLGLIGSLAFVQDKIAAMAGTILPEAFEKVDLGLWHGINGALILSIITLIVGFLLFKNLNMRESKRPVVGSEKSYFAFLSNMNKLASFHYQQMQTGYLRNYLGVTLLFLVVMIGVAVYIVGQPAPLNEILTVPPEYPFYQQVIILSIPIAVGIIFFTNSRVKAIITLGIVGFSLALIFIYYGAPDVAITQLLVETLTVVFFVIILHKLPEFKTFAPKYGNVGYFVISLIFGLAMTYVMIQVMYFDIPDTLKGYFGEASYLEGKGKNIVNVILVDFRALDTMGEIAVLAIAATGVISMLRLKDHSELNKSSNKKVS
ncbi:MAG: DUF4040 domain-containing protein [Cyclobacteriaceae bacterium]|nr:DUF4040 domain-containing protein [Cyclobacteriaceae bacterium]MCH8516416.1 DUF4040 domain-containing protein [Cyclobacteriaceae bacterium]